MHSLREFRRSSKAVSTSCSWRTFYLRARWFFHRLHSLAALNQCSTKEAWGGGYPGAMRVAVAVADARKRGLLPSANLEVSNKVRFQQIMRDVVKLQARLDRIRNHIADAGSNDFSLLLAGPGFWAHYHLKPGGVLARYHANGPLRNEVVVITHQAVLSALLRGTISITQATDLGLLEFSGANPTPVKVALESSL